VAVRSIPNLRQNFRAHTDRPDILNKGGATGRASPLPYQRGRRPASGSATASRIASREACSGRLTRARTSASIASAAPPLAWWRIPGRPSPLPYVAPASADSPALSLAFQLPPGKARPSRSLATADTDCLRWRASNHSRSWTSSVNRRLRALVFSAGAGRLRWARDGGDKDPL
jgi:hypothetical protein